MTRRIQASNSGRDSASLYNGITTDIFIYDNYLLMLRLRIKALIRLTIPPRKTVIEKDDQR